MSLPASDPAATDGPLVPVLSLGQKPPSSCSSKEVQFITVKPVLLTFDALEAPSCQRTLTLKNTSQQRIAWRVRTNAPTRYVVAPACGFLTPTESIVVTVDLTDVSKYSKRHRFMLQAMEATEEEKDRKEFWNSERALKSVGLHCVRVFTESAEPNVVVGNGLSSPVNSSSNCSATQSSTRSSYSSSSGSSGSSGTTGTSWSSSESSGSTASSSISTCSTFSTTTTNSTSSSVESVTDRVKHLTLKIRKAMDEKELASQKMVTVVNEVKKIEVELDRAGAVCKDLNGRVVRTQEQIKELELRSSDIEKQLKPLKEAK